MGALADCVSDETAAVAEEVAGDARLDARSFVRQRIEQMITFRDVEAISDLAGRIRARRAANFSYCGFYVRSRGSRPTQMNANLIT